MSYSIPRNTGIHTYKQKFILFYYFIHLNELMSLIILLRNCTSECAYRMALLPFVDLAADLGAPRFGEAGRARVGGRHVAPRVRAREPPAHGTLDDDRRAPALELLACAAREQLALAVAAEAGLDAASGALQLLLNRLHGDKSKSPMDACGSGTTHKVLYDTAK